MGRLNILFEAGSVPCGGLAIVGRVDEISLQLGVLFQHGPGFFHPHDHKCRSIGVGCGTVGGHDGCREKRMLEREARFRIDGMRIFSPVLIVVIAVVTARSQGRIVHPQYDLVAAGRVGVFLRLAYADAPRAAVGVLSLRHDFAADFHHIILNAVAVEQGGHTVQSSCIRLSAFTTLPSVSFTFS